MRDYQNRRMADPDDSEAHIHRRKVDSDSVLRLHSRVSDCERNIAGLLISQRDMTENLNRLTENLGRVAEVLETFNNAKGFWLTIKFFSAFIGIMLPIIGLLGAVWLFVKTGQWLGIK